MTENLTFKNPRLPHLSVITAHALVDTGCTCLCIPESICAQLALETLETREAELADGSRKFVRYVGPVEVRFRGRAAYCGALVMGDQVLLGVIPMEDMDLIVVPKTQTLEFNPRGAVRV